MHARTDGRTSRKHISSGGSQDEQTGIIAEKYTEVKLKSDHITATNGLSFENARIHIGASTY